MSSIGTGIAAGVAQTGLQSQQVSRAQGKQQADKAQQEKASTDRFDAELRAADKANDPDGELPDRQAPGYEQLYQHPEHDEAGEDQPEASETIDPDNPPPAEGPLYKHLDIQA